MNKSLAPASPQGFSAADHILRRAIPYYGTHDYATIPYEQRKFLEEQTFSLEYPKEYSAWRIAIHFTKIEGREDVMWVRSTNWRCEHEPNGAMKIEAARRLYQRLVATGMRPF